MTDYYSRGREYILLGLGLVGLICCLPRWRERRNQRRITPKVEHRIMVNPMRIETEKIVRMI